MNELEDLRQYVENTICEVDNEIVDGDYPEGREILDILVLSGRRRELEKVQNLIPEQEYDAVLNYWALFRVSKMEFDRCSWQDPIPVLRAKMYEHRRQAIELVKKRSRVLEHDDERVTVFDPVSKHRVDYMDSHDRAEETAMQRLAETVVDRGL